MLFEDLKPLILYRGQPFCPVPKGEPTVGKGNCLFLLNPDKARSMEMLASGTYLNYTKGMYRRYFIDQIYHQKIGTKQIIQKISSKESIEFKNYDFEGSLMYIPKSTLRSITKNQYNIFCDLGEWNRLFFEYRRKRSPMIMAEEYFSFVKEKILDDRFDEYTKTVVIDVAAWAEKLSSKITFKADSINNPFTILLFLLYKKPEVFEELKNIQFLIYNSEERMVLFLHGSDFIKENYGKIKRFFSNLTKINIEVEKIEDISVDEEEILTNAKINASDEKQRIVKAREEIRQQIRRQFMTTADDVEISESEYNDIANQMSEELDDEKDESNPSSKLNDEELEEEIEKTLDKITANKSVEELELMTKDASDREVGMAVKEISKKVYENKFMPTYSKVEINRIERLRGKQDSIIRPISSKEAMESKIIDKEDLSSVINTPNQDYAQLQFANFAKSYNKKKYEQDIDRAVATISNGKKKVFVVGKEVKDTSTQISFKETRTYHLEDETGKKMTIKFDLPKIIDDHYIFINGNKKILHNQLVAKPIIKNKPDQIKINTFYNKLIVERAGLEDALAAPVTKFLLKNEREYGVKIGNGEKKNGKYITTLEMSILGSKIFSYNIGDWMFITSIPDMIDHLMKKNIKLSKVDDSNYPIGFNTRTKEVLYFDSSKDSYIEKIIGAFDETTVNQINKIKISSRQFYSQVKIMNKKLPIAFLICHTIGLTEMLNRANIETEWVPMEEKKAVKGYDPHVWGSLQLGDGFLMWKREPMQNAMLMNGLNSKNIDFTLYTREEMDNKDTYIICLGRFFNYMNMSSNLDQYADFMIDDVTKEILEDFHYPTDYIGLLLLANQWLCTTDFIPETDMRNLRVRSNELISQHVYKAITTAYGNYRKTAHRTYSKPISMPQDQVMNLILSSGLTEEESIVNPFMEIEKIHSVTYRGESGIGESRAMTLEKRAYSESMLGILAITTSNDANVGVSRIMTLEPSITSTRGYIDFKGKDGIDDLSAANLLAPGELLTPLGVEHDDPARTAMAVKQSKQMIPIDDSEPGMITNGFDRVLPYRLSKEFTIVAEDDGTIVEEKDGLVVIKYNNGRYQTIDTNPIVKKNGAAGFWILTNMQCDKKKGDKVKKNEVVGYEKQAFKKNIDDLSASMTRGPFVKLALIPRWDGYEDSNPITANTSDRLASTLVMEESCTIKASSKIYHMAKIGDKVNSRDDLIRYDEYSEDKEVQEFMQLIQSKLNEEGDSFVESSATTFKATHTGEIVDIKIYATIPTDQMSPSVREIVEGYYSRLNRRIKTLEKYKNPDENKYYMSGQMVTEFPEVLEPDDRGLLKGHRMDGEILICFFIKYKDYIKKGDKITAEFALKGIDSQVIPKGLEPYSEYRPDEEIGMIMAPHSPTARKTTAIFKSMFINKLLIEKKRQLIEYWNSVRPDLK